MITQEDCVATTMTDGDCTRKLAPVLEGRVLGFFTSNDIMGGSEVLLADVIEGAAAAGAEIVCWSPPGAAIRHLLKQRHIEAHMRDWGAAREPEAVATPSVQGLDTGT